MEEAYKSVRPVNGLRGTPYKLSDNNNHSVGYEHCAVHIRIICFRRAEGNISKNRNSPALNSLLGLPAGVGMCTLARPIIQLLYASLDVTEVVKAGSILSVLSIGVVFLTAIQALTGILQGIDQVAVPVRNLFIGAMAKVVVSYILIGIPEVNILGAAIGTVICYLTAALLDFAAVVKYRRFPDVWVDGRKACICCSFHGSRCGYSV